MGKCIIDTSIDQLVGKIIKKVAVDGTYVAPKEDIYVGSGMLHLFLDDGQIMCFTYKSGFYCDMDLQTGDWQQIIGRSVIFTEKCERSSDETIYAITTRNNTIIVKFSGPHNLVMIQEDDKVMQEDDKCFDIDDVVIKRDELERWCSKYLGLSREIITHNKHRIIMSNIKGICYEFMSKALEGPDDWEFGTYEFYDSDHTERDEDEPCTTEDMQKYFITRFFEYQVSIWRVRDVLYSKKNNKTLYQCCSDLGHKEDLCEEGLISLKDFMSSVEEWFEQTKQYLASRKFIIK